MLEDAALASAAADLSRRPAAERLKCPQCGADLAARGHPTRELTTHFNQAVHLKRSYAVCPQCGEGFFPLDEELGLVPGQLTPRLQESLTRLGTWMPFRPAAAELAYFTGVTVSETTARRVAEQAGAAYVAAQTAEVTKLERTLPPPPVGPDRLLMSTDGAFVPLVGGEWTEVKTLVLGVIGEPVVEKGEQVVHTEALSYFSRRSEAADFTRQALVETQRRGVETAGQVAAVTDGAEWIQGFIDYHRRDATRILDFPHALEHVALAGRVVHGDGTPAFTAWFEPLAHRLKHDAPEETLRELRHLLKQAQVAGLPEEGLATIQAQLDYLDKRRSLIAYAEFQHRGLPIGSGCVESANKLVVESRMKQAGMRWALDHVNPMLALRNVASNDRWAEAWPQMIEQRREHRRRRAQARSTPPGPVPEAPLLNTPTVTATLPNPAVVKAPSTPIESAPPAKSPYRPAPDHIWRRSPIGRARVQPSPAKI
jgi:predicted RNA-binding Zn-ribbon protein involved in translation (DUF1610 family)